MGTKWVWRSINWRVLCYQHWDKSVKMVGHVLLKICITWRSKVHGNGSLHFYPHQSSISLLRMTSVCVASLNYSSPCPRQIFSQTVGKHFFCRSHLASHYPHSQAFSPHCSAFVACSTCVNTASYKHWGEKAWVRGWQATTLNDVTRIKSIETQITLCAHKSSPIVENLPFRSMRTSAAGTGVSSNRRKGKVSWYHEV